MLVLIGVLGVAGARHDAVETRLPAAVTACVAAAESPVDAAACYQAEFRRQDAELNAVYERLMLARSGEAKANLRYKQRAWIRAKEATCASEAIDADEETVSGVAGAACYLRLTSERLRFLQTFDAQETAGR